MTPLFIGYDDQNARIALTPADLETHVHGIGASRSGKSKLIEWMVREMIRDGQGFCLIDPHGFLYWDLVRWLAWVKPEREVVLFNPSSQGRVVGFNPFRPGPGDVSTQVGRRVRATVKAWGDDNTDRTPRLERWLRCLYYTLIEGGYSLEVARYLFTWKRDQVRAFLTRSITSELIRDQWEELAAFSRAQEFSDQIESTRNRLFRLIEPTQVRRVMGLPENNLDVERIIEEGKILLVNLQPSPVLDDENARVIGTLLLNEIWEVGKRREQTKLGGNPTSFFLIIDEFQKYLTADVPSMLDQGAKYGLHLMLFHQHLAQLRERDPEIYGSVMTNARTKIVFGGLSRDDARAMAEQIFPGQVDLKRIKFALEQTKFRPIYTREKVYTSTKGQGHVSAAGASSGMAPAWDPALGQWVTAFSSAEVSNSGDVAHWSEGECDIPFFLPEEFTEVSSIVPYSLEESLWEISDRLMEQSQRHFIIRRPGRPTVAGVTPFVQNFLVTSERLHGYVESQLTSFLLASEVDARLERIHHELVEKVGDAKPRKAAASRAKLPRPDADWDF